MYFLGMDGGGTGCRAALSDIDGHILGEGRAGSANMASDFEGALGNILSAAEQALAGRDPGQVRAVLGLAGSNFSGMGARMEAALPFRARVVQDVTTSVRGALGTADGIVAAIGTGSVFARQSDGQIRAIGGWGLRLGDEASGAWIGRALLMRATRMLDGYIPPTPLLAQIAGELGGAPGIVTFSLRATAAEYAALAPRVLAAEATDPAAAHVLDAARAEIRSAIQNLQPREAPLPVVWIGGLGPKLALTDWPMQSPLGTSLDGALLMAREESTWQT
ncbi:ATPase [Sedimentimonas flavescens]|uniref:ATPase n=1 Tax=Sedimentimonas flavescens TaxID=2851012 RepID=A0ABT2ZUP6_9RHOB|nr:BadF/BadG/BcrA/BcrD ATPase family protein [Sedimentimonas flavescens]MCV2877254.1 ATPase [Sedimentimonas flavescens]